MLDLIIENGTVVSPSGTYRADVAVEAGKIAAVGSRSLFGKAKRVIDAAGKYVMPGMVDVHTHIYAPFMGCVGSVDFYTGSIACAFGGVTSFIDFANTKPGDSILRKVKDRREEMETCVIDHGVHTKIVETNPNVLREIKEVVAYGCPSIKMFMTYKDEGVMISDEGMLDVMEEAVKYGALPGVHAECDPIAARNVRRLRSEGHLTWDAFPGSKPVLCEKEAVQRAILFAQYAGSPLYIFHLTSAEGLAAVRSARRRGLPVLAETCTHYLTLTDKAYARTDGYKFLMSPPLRKKADQDALWGALRDGTLSAVSSDNSAYTTADKEKYLERDAAGRPVPDFTKVVNGVTGAEERLPLLLGKGVQAGRLTLSDVCRIGAYEPARVFGMFPEKGIIQQGSDADIVLVDMELEKTVRYQDMHYLNDFSIYEGMTLKGWPVMTIAGGKVIVENGEFTGEKGSGRFLQRKPFRRA